MKWRHSNGGHLPTPLAIPIAGTSFACTLLCAHLTGKPFKRMVTLACFWLPVLTNSLALPNMIHIYTRYTPCIKTIFKCLISAIALRQIPLLNRH